MQEARAFMMDQVGAWLIKQKKTAEAERMLEKSIRLFPGANDAWLRLAQLLIKRRDYANAAKLLLEAFDAVPDFDMALVFLAECHFKMGEAGKARDVLSKVTARNPRNVAVLINTGYVYSEASLNVEALSAVLSAKTLEPHNPAAWVNHSIALLALGRLDEAIGVATQAMEFGNSIYRASSLAVIGDALYRKNQIDEAQAAYERALQFNGKDVGAHLGILQVLLRKKNVEGAVAKIADIQALKPGSHDALYAMALYLVAQGKRDEAIQCLQQAVSKSPLLKNDLKTEPLLDPIRSDPRFLALIGG
jgi:superkiller protein 3